MFADCDNARPAVRLQLIIETLKTLKFKGNDQGEDRTIGIAGDLVSCVNSLTKKCQTSLKRRWETKSIIFVLQIFNDGTSCKSNPSEEGARQM